MLKFNIFQLIKGMVLLMSNYNDLALAELEILKKSLQTEYDAFKAKCLKLDMARGKPGAYQLDISMDILKAIHGYKAKDGTDCRNYGGLEGIAEARELFAEMLEVTPDEIIIGGNSSLNMMYDAITRAMLLGVLDSEKPWGKYDKIKFLCPVPGYDRHFAICEQLGIEMINIDMRADGPDMDEIERLVALDDTIKGIWCVPKYSNPDGITYSDAVVERFARLKPAAKDFRIFWDNAYCVHHLNGIKDKLKNILTECRKYGNQNMVFIFSSTSKISFPGAGLAMMAASGDNIALIKKQLSIQTIGPDKINQLQHANYFKNLDGIMEHMKKHQEILKPKFDTVLNKLEEEFKNLDIAKWIKPNGGYFISFYSMEGCAKRIIELAKGAGVTMTPAGATFPYGYDPKDSNIRIAPTFPPLSELISAMEIFCVCVKLATVEKLINGK